MKINLSVRMKMNASLVPAGARVADVGCDHGYVAIWLVKERDCPHVIASDVNEGPLRRAERNISDAGLSDRIETRLGDGLQILAPGETDAVLIAGMGGMRICEILSASTDILSDTTFVLQPQSDVEEVRRHLHRLGFRIERESICLEDGKYYMAIRAVPGSEERPYTDTEYRFSRLLAEEGGSVYRSYMRQMTDKLSGLLQSLDGLDTDSSEGSRIATRKEELEAELKALRSKL